MGGEPGGNARFENITADSLTVVCDSVCQQAGRAEDQMRIGIRNAQEGAVTYLNALALASGVGDVFALGAWGARVALGRFAANRTVSNSTRLLPPPSLIPNAGGKIVSDVTQSEQVFFRIFSGNKTQGAFLTRVPPTNSAQAIEGLALPPGNTAEFIQRVMVPAGTRLQRSRALPIFGRRGGKEQFELLDKIPTSSFGSGVPFK